MSTQSVLFDAPGPKTVKRHRLYTVLTLVGLAGLLGFIGWRLAATGQFGYDKIEPFLTPSYLVALLVDGVLVTLSMAGAAVLGAVAFGLVFGLGKLSDRAWISWPSFLVVEFFRAVPVLILMILVFFTWGINRGDLGAYLSVVIALTLYNGAVLAEVFRAGINAVPKGQGEAALAIGLRKGQVTWIVLLPQAVKIMLPALISQCVVTLKDTSLGYAVAAPGLTKVGQAIYTQFQNQVPTVMVIAALYIAMNLMLTYLATLAQAKFVGEKDPLKVAGGAQTGI